MKNIMKIVATTQFNPYVDFVSTKKLQVNRKVLEFAYKLPVVKGAIFMDGKDMNTSNTLIQSGLIDGKKIHVPEIDPETQKVHQASGLVTSHFGKLEDFLQKTPINILKNINLVFFDTMGMPEGNYSKKLYPLESLMTYLLKCQEGRIIVCLTYCLRSNGLFPGRKNMIEQIEKDYVFPCFKWCQYKIVSHENMKYHRDSPNNRKTQEMLFMAFELEKDLTIDKNKVDFVTKTIQIKGKYQTVYSGYAPDQ